MSDTSQTSSDPTTPTTPPTATPPDSSIPQRDPQGNLLEPGETPPTKTQDGTPPKSPEQTSTPPKDAPKTSEGAPEKYGDFKLPEGYTLDAKVVDEVTPIFKELGLTQDQAQKLVEFHTNQMIAAAKGPQTAFETLQSDWRAKTASDPDLKAAVNGDKTGLEAVKLDIGRALNSIGDAKLIAEFKDVMNQTGVGDNPAFVKALWKMSQHITEGKHVSGSGPSIHGQSDPSKGTPRTGATALYPNLPQ